MVRDVMRFDVMPPDQCDVMNNDCTVIKPLTNTLLESVPFALVRAAMYFRIRQGLCFLTLMLPMLHSSALIHMYYICSSVHYLP